MRKMRTEMEKRKVDQTNSKRSGNAVEGRNDVTYVRKKEEGKRLPETKRTKIK